MFESCIFINIASLLLIHLPSFLVQTVPEFLNWYVGIQSIFFPQVRTQQQNRVESSPIKLTKTRQKLAGLHKIAASGKCVCASRVDSGRASRVLPSQDS
jgi:hypothetical protein